MAIIKGDFYDFSKLEILDVRDGKSRIYRIINTLTNEIIYIGCTKNSVYKRFLVQVSEVISYKESRNLKFIKIAKALSTNSLSLDVVYEFNDRQKAEIVEKHLINYISKFGNIKHSLSNTIAINRVSENVFYQNFNNYFNN